MAAKIGSLRADLTLETGRFRAGAADARAQMASLRTSFKADSKQIRAAANDMGVGVQAFARDLSGLKARLDPMSAATAEYRREVDLARKALDLGAISGKQYGQAVVLASQKLAQIRGELKGVSDGGATKELSADMAALQARLNPAAASLAAYRAEARLMRQAQREGVISTQQFVAGMQQATASYKQAQTEIAAANGAARAGMQQLGMQINDAVTMYAMGAPLAQIFASQSGQAAQAAQLMLGTSSKFGAFMAGPWGVAITAGIVVLSALAPKLLETETAMKDVQMASDALGDAQSVLGRMFDLTTGKLEKQNAMLRLNVQIMAYNLRMQAAAEKANYEKTMATFGKGKLGLSMGQKALGAIGVDVGGAMSREDAVRQVAQQFRSEMTAAKTDKQRFAATQKAFRAAEGLDFSGLAQSRDQFLAGIRDGATYSDKNKISDAALEALDGKLNPMFRENAKPKTPRKPSGKTAEELAADQAREIKRLGIEELRAKLDLATNAEDRAELSFALLAAERDQRIAEIDANKDFSADQKAAQKAYITRLYGASAQGEDIVVNGGLLQRKLSREIAAEENRLANDMLSRQGDVLQAWADIEPNMRERAKLEEKALEIQQQIQRNLLEQSILNGVIADADRARVLLARKEAAERERLRLQTMTPGQRYVYDLRSQAANINDAVEEIEIHGLESLNDQLADAIVNFDSLGDVAQNVLKQILADLIRLQLQKSIIAPIANSIFGGATAINGVSGTKFLSGLGGQIDSWAGGTTVSLAGTRAGGGSIRPGLPYLVGEHGPEIVVPGATSHVIPNHELAGIGGSIAQIVPSPYFDVVVDRRAAQVAGPMSAQAAGVGSRGAQVAMARQRSRSLV